jgi:hypothetical protein
MHNPLSTAWTIMIAVVVSVFAVPAAIWLGILVGVPILLIGLAFSAAAMVRLRADKGGDDDGPTGLAGR